MLVTYVGDREEKGWQRKEGTEVPKVNKRVDMLHDDSGTTGLQKWWG